MPQTYRDASMQITELRDRNAKLVAALGEDRKNLCRLERIKCACRDQKKYKKQGLVTPPAKQPSQISSRLRRETI